MSPWWLALQSWQVVAADKKKETRMSLTREMAFEMGKEAFVRGLPSIPMLNKKFWELNSKTESHDWLGNIKAYTSGWLQANKEAMKWKPIFYSDK